MALKKVPSMPFGLTCWWHWDGLRRPTYRQALKKQLDAAFGLMYVPPKFGLSLSGCHLAVGSHAMSYLVILSTCEWIGPRLKMQHTSSILCKYTIKG